MGFLSDAAEKLTCLPEYRPFPAYGDRAAWSSLASGGDYVKAAEGLSQAEYPVLPAWRYMDFQRNGNRSRYESLYFERRDRIVTFLIAECCEGRGRFTEGLVNGLWALLEETTWVVPAHNEHYPAGRKYSELGDVEAKTYIDLFAAETGALVAAVYSVMKKPLDELSPLIARRCEIEVEKRILGPYMDNDDIFWMGFHGETVNNWNPWINQNVLLTFLLMEKDPDRRLRSAQKTMRSTQRFLDGYAPDGGCDEGPGYFTVAGACYLDLCEMLYEATGGALDFFKEPLTRNIARYQYAAHISGDRFTNYADAHCKISANGRQFLRLADKLQSPELYAFGARQEALKPAFSGKNRVSVIYRHIKGLFTPLPAEKPACRAVLSQYYPGIQVCMARQKADTDEGLFFSAKGGHNQESHNHNDVGTFLLYRDGEPVVIDAGVGAYTKKTFSAQRYEIWSMQSEYHNVPLCRGMGQRPGLQYAAKDARFEDDGKKLTFSLDISGAYPPGCKALRRFEFDREKGKLTLEDTGDGLTEHFLLPDEPRLGEGRIGLNGVDLTYDPAVLAASAQSVEIDDETMRREWGRDRFWRLTLRPREGAESWVIRFDLA